MSNYVVSDTSLASVADAIREKGGTTAALEYPDGFVSAIGEIETGGGGGRVSVLSKDVDFIDYDGTIVYSYTAEEFLALSAMPENPDHSGDDVPLTAQGWNWTLADAQEQVGMTGELTIGQLYIPTDGKTHIKIHLEKGRTSPILGVCPNGTVDVDWGDGTAHSTLTGTSVTTLKYTSAHEYAAAGDYWITMAVTGTARITGASSSGTYLLRHITSGDGRNAIYRQAIDCMFVGANMGMGDYALNFCRGLQYLTIPKSVIYWGTGVFYNCLALKCFIYPNIDATGQYAFYSAHPLLLVSFPQGMTIISSYTFQFCRVLRKIDIPYTVTKIEASAFQGIEGLSRITIPANVNTIENLAFGGINTIKELCMLPTTPPTLTSNNAFSNIPTDCIIYVPRGCLSTYKSATNWSTYASKMQEEPQ